MELFHTSGRKTSINFSQFLKISHVIFFTKNLSHAYTPPYSDRVGLFLNSESARSQNLQHKKEPAIIFPLITVDVFATHQHDDQCDVSPKM